MEKVMRDNFVSFLSPNELQKEVLIYSDGMGFEQNPSFFIEREGFNNYLVMYTISGELVCVQNGEEIAVLPGEAILVDLHQYHRYHFREGVPSKIAWAHMNGTPIISIVQQLQKKHPFPVKMKSQEIYDRLMALFEISDLPGWDVWRQSEQCYAIWLVFLREVWNECADEKEDSRKQKFKQTIWQVIAHNLHRDITLEELARAVSLSKYHFAHTFHETFGMPPMQFITEERIRQAKYRLCNTTEQVNEIAEALGFSESGYFSKVFKKECGCTPTEYRNQNRGYFK